jgi:uncharacterized protein
MKLHPAIFRLLGLAALCVLITGCFLKPVNVTTRRFVLAPVPAPGHANETNQLTVGLGPVKMPDYLLKDAMAVRRSDNEIEYLENALWAGRLDHAFQLALAANLTTQLPGSRFPLSAWQAGEVVLAAYVRVERLDVNAQGTGTLAAHWQIETPDRRRVLKSGEVALHKFGTTPYADPEASVATLSALTAQFSEVLAQAIRECAASVPVR